jgi:hypothetical protein
MPTLREDLEAIIDSYYGPARWVSNLTLRAILATIRKHRAEVLALIGYSSSEFDESVWTAETAGRSHAHTEG